MKTQYEITVFGRTWEGMSAFYSGTFDSIPENFKYEFGDFESLDDWRITQVDKNFEQVNENTTRNTITRTVIKDWDKKNRESDYQDTLLYV